MTRGRIGVVLAMTAAGAFVAGCGAAPAGSDGCRLEVVMTRLPKTIQLDWTFHNDLGVPVWIPVRWQKYWDSDWGPNAGQARLVDVPGGGKRQATLFGEDTSLSLPTGFFVKPHRIWTPEDVIGPDTEILQELVFVGGCFDGRRERDPGHGADNRPWRVWVEKVSPGGARTGVLRFDVPYRIPHNLRTPRQVDTTGTSFEEVSEDGTVEDGPTADDGGRLQIRRPKKVMAIHLWLGTEYWLSDPEQEWARRAAPKGREYGPLERMVVMDDIIRYRDYTLFEREPLLRRIAVSNVIALDPPVEVIREMRDPGAPPEDDAYEEKALEEWRRYSEEGDSPETREKEKSKDTKDSKAP
ncbi:MAG: hypothetical protein NTV86_21860 [Planctomycetota bacterium]|nr:hypothetical protein [Planctomycetota bacterium]